MREARKLEHYIIQYCNFLKAKRVGVVFSPEDLSMEQITAFDIIQDKISEIELKKSRKWQKK